MAEFERLLNQQQLECVKTTEGAVLVIAGAGSGKTRVLTYRIAYLISELGVSPYQILAITFTNKATKEMQERLEKTCDNSKALWVSTFHSFCARVLRRDIDKLGYDKSFTIYDDTDSSRVIKRILDSKHVEGKGLERTIAWHISNAKNKGLSPEQYANQVTGENADLYVDVYAAYEEVMKSNNALDYDDLLLKTVILFTQNQDVLEYYANRFRYIHIDEYQDTNKLQYLLVKMLSSVHGNVFAVGDEDQSIYGWRGADIGNIIHFQQDYAGAKVIKLERNYRSTAKILNAANVLIRNNSSRYGKVMWTDDTSGEDVTIYKLGTDGDEADYVVRQIAAGINKGASPKDYAVLVRLNALTNRLEERFTTYGIPYKVFGGMKFFERKEIKDVLAYCRMIVNPRDDEAVLRVINVPKRNIGDTVVEQYRAYCAERSYTLLEPLMSGLEECDLPAATIKKLAVFRDLYMDLHGKYRILKASDMVEYIINSTGIKKSYEGDDEENYNHRMNLDELVNTVKTYEKENGEVDLGTFLQSVSLASDSDDIQTDDYVSIATVHSVKGLEFNVVFIVGLEENIFPSNAYNKSETEIEEERRVMYVAMTRARKKLYMTSCWQRYRFGRQEYNKESRFLDEIKRGLLGDDYQKIKGQVQAKRVAGATNARVPYTAQPTEKQTAYVPQYTAQKPSENSIKLRIGQKVEHKKFGLGTVIKLDGDNASIVFGSGVGIKTLNVKVAPLTIVD